MLSHPAEYFQSKYYCISSARANANSKVFNHGKLKQSAQK